jgi:hypothetical protein
VEGQDRVVRDDGIGTELAGDEVRVGLEASALGARRHRGVEASLDSEEPARGDVPGQHGVAGVLAPAPAVWAETSSACVNTEWVAKDAAGRGSLLHRVDITITMAFRAHHDRPDLPIRAREPS